MGQGRGIVDPVADHGDGRAVVLEARNLGGLILGQDFGQHSCNTGLTGNRLGGILVISCQHDRFEPHLLKPTDRLGSLRLERIGDRDQSDDAPVDHHVERCLPLTREALAKFRHIVRLNTTLGKKPPAAHQDEFPIDSGFDAVSGQGNKRLDRPERQTLRLGLLHNGLSQRMLAVPFRTRGYAQYLLAAQRCPLG